jgi:PAS domain S-box-containing protein
MSSTADHRLRSARDSLLEEAVARTPTIGLVVMDGDGVVRSWNGGATALFGHEAHEAVGRAVADLIVPAELRDAHRSGLGRLRSTGRPHRLGGTFTVPARRADGSSFVVSLALLAVEVDGDEWYLGVAADPAERPSPPVLPAGSALESIFERAPEAITVLDRDRRQRTVNAAGAKLLGYGSDGRFPGDGRSLIHPDDLVRTRDHLDAVAEGAIGGEVPVRYRVLAGDGGWRWLETVTADLRDVDGIDGFIAFSRDVTADETRRAELHASEARLSAVITSLPAAAVVEDSDRMITDHNVVFLDLLGLPRERALVGEDIRPHLDVLSAETTSPAVAAARLARGTYQRTPTSLPELHLRDGRILEVEIVPIRSDVASVGRLWLFRDVSDRVRAEVQLQGALDREQEARRLAEERAEQLRRIDASRVAFVSSVSHELRTPLTSILSAAEFLADAEDVDRQLLAQYLHLIRRNAGRLGRLAEDVLVLGRLEAGLLPVMLAPVDLPALVEELVDERRLVAAARSMSIVVQTSPGPLMPGDDLRLRQVVDNLITNAVKFGDEGTDVRVECIFERGAWLLAVTDDGGGIVEDDVERVFEPFYRSETAESHAIPGSGLGLRIVRGIVSLHGGEVHVDRAHVGGARILCRFPVAVAPE